MWSSNSRDHGCRCLLLNQAQWAGYPAIPPPWLVCNLHASEQASDPSGRNTDCISINTHAKQIVKRRGGYVFESHGGYRNRSQGIGPDLADGGHRDRTQRARGSGAGHRLGDRVPIWSFIRHRCGNTMRHTSTSASRANLAGLFTRHVDYQPA